MRSCLSALVLILLGCLLGGCGPSAPTASPATNPDSGAGDGPTASGPQLLDVYGDTDWQAARCYLGTHYYEAARSVCRIDIPGKGKCTGFLVGPDLVMTNEHCIATASEAQSSTFRFDYEASACGNGGLSHVEYQGAELLYVSVDFDASLVRLTDSDWPGTRPWLAIHREQPVAGEVIYIPQHPGTGPKVIAVDSDDDYDNDPAMSPDIPPGTEGLGHLLTLTPGELSNRPWYRLDTDGGSSGSPVIRSADDSVIALHAQPGNRGAWMYKILPDIRHFLEPEAAAVIYFDRDAGTVPVDGSTTLHLKDGDLAGTGSQVVTVTTSEGDSETLALVETAAGNGHFTAALTIVHESAVAEDGTLQSSHMGTARAVYQDLDDGSGATVERRTEAWFDGRIFRYWEEQITDLEQVQITFTPDLDQPNRYRVCSAPASELPVDPTGMTVLPIDELTSMAELVPDQPLRLYSRDYDRLFVWRYGQVTANAEDGGYGKRETFFTGPRVAPAAGPWGLSASGAVGYQELADRLVVTWQAVSQWSQPVLTDLQLEWFHDGRLRFTILAVDPNARLNPGISGGVMPDSDEVAWDFSAAPGCNGVPEITSLTADPASGILTETDLSVVASDPEGESLSYDWAVIEAPTGATPQIVGSGATVTVQFDALGDYRVQVTARDPALASASTSIDLTVAAAPTTIVISP